VEGLAQLDLYPYAIVRRLDPDLPQHGADYTYNGQIGID
jgi:hypothetical protein